MNDFDDLPPLDIDRLLNDLYALQASLKMMIDQLARTRTQEWNRDLIAWMVIMHQELKYSTPSLTRH